MRKLIATIVLFGGIITWLVTAGVMAVTQPAWEAWIIWALLMPALLVVTAIIAPRRKPAPPEATTIIYNTHNPRYGEMKEGN